MSTIKDLIDLLTEFSNKKMDRKVINELTAIQSLALQIQSESAQLHETNVKLREDNLNIKKSLSGSSVNKIQNFYYN